MAKEIKAKEKAILEQFYELHTQLYKQAKGLVVNPDSYRHISEAQTDQLNDQTVFLISFVEMMAKNPYRRLCALNAQLELWKNTFPFSQILPTIKELMLGLEKRAVENSGLLEKCLSYE